MSPPIAGVRPRWLAFAAGLLAALTWIVAVPQAQAAFTTGKCAGADAIGRGASFARDAHTLFNSNFRNLYCTGTPGAGAINVDYQALGSGAGRLAMKVRNDTPRFGMTDEPPSTTEVQQMNAGTGNNPPASDTVTTDNGQIHVVPAAVGAIAPLVNFPDNCDVNLLPAAAKTPAQDRDGDAVDDDVIRVRFTKAQFESIWAGDPAAAQWDQVFTELAVDADCDKDIIRVVRFDESGSTFTLKDYLNTINPGRGWLTTYASGANGTREWPGATFGARSDCAGANGPGGGATEATDRLTSSCSSNAGNLTSKLIATDGSIGYADVSTARNAATSLAITPEANDNDTYWTQVPNGAGTFTEPTFDSFGFRTDGAKGANCLSATFQNVPASTFGNWAPVSGVNSNAGYGICTLTYGLLFDDNAAVWGNSAGEESKAKTVKDYWDSILTDSAQVQLFGSDYAALPANILAISRTGVGQIDWDKANNPPPPPPPPPPTPDPTPDPTPEPVSNNFSIQRTKIDSKKGSVTVQVRLPGAGEVEMVGKSAKPKVNVGRVTLDANDSGTFPITLKPSNAAKRVLKDKGKLKIELSLTFSPDGGESAKKSTDAKLKLNKK